MNSKCYIITEILLVSYMQKGLMQNKTLLEETKTLKKKDFFLHTFSCRNSIKHST